MRKNKPLSFHIGGFFFSLGSNIIGEELEILLKFAPCCLFLKNPIEKLHGRHPKQQHAKEKEQINSRQEEADTKETRTKSTKRKSFVCTSTTTLLQTSSIFFCFLVFVPHHVVHIQHIGLGTDQGCFDNVKVSRQKWLQILAARASQRD